MEPRRWRIGELAAATGLTVRTLRHYEHEGLLVPSGRTEAGHRVYADTDIQRLYEVIALRRLGLSLREIREQLAQPRDLREVLRDHLATVQREIEAQHQLARRIRFAIASIDRAGQPSQEALFNVIEGMTMLERYLSADAVQALRTRREELGPEAETQRMELLRELQAAHDEGLAPIEPRVKELANKLQRAFVELVRDPQVAAGLARMIEAEGPAEASHGLVSPELQAYWKQALE